MNEAETIIEIIDLIQSLDIESHLPAKDIGFGRIEKECITEGV